VQVSQPEIKLPPVIQLYPYQQRWVDDHARFKGAIKAARTGFTFGTAVEVTLDCLESRAYWNYLSASDAQAVEFMEEGVGKIKEAMNFTAEIYSEPFADELGKTDIIQHCCKFANGARIRALPCNPRTARGFPGNSVLDEFAHVEDSYAIWAAILRGIALGHKLRVLSTPNGEQGKFYDLAKAVGLTDAVAPAENPFRPKRPDGQPGAWSWHYLDAPMAIAEGCPINLEEMREGMQDDDAFNQELMCVFLKAVGAWLTLDLISGVEDSGCDSVVVSDYRDFNLQTVLDRCTGGPLHLGIDFGRSGDRTCAWLHETVGDIAWCRLILYLHNMPFFVSEEEHKAGRMDQEQALLPLVWLANRTALDSTGLGLPLYEKFNADRPGHVMGVNFAGSIKRMEQGDATTRVRSGLAETVAIKIAMATAMKRRYEQRKNRIPHDAQVRGELMAIKREQSSTAITFDAPRIEVDTAIAGGAKKKIYSHAEAFWAQAMADLAAAQPAAHLSDGVIVGTPRAAMWLPEAMPAEF
jgi:phage FluMu gp28-like protein